MKSYSNAVKANLNQKPNIPVKVLKKAIDQVVDAGEWRPQKM